MVATNPYEGDRSILSCLPHRPPLAFAVLVFLLSSFILTSIPNSHLALTVFAQPPEILIDVSSAKSQYQIGEIAQLDIMVTNNMADTTTCFFGLSLRDPEGRVSIYDSQIGLTKGSAVLGPSQSTSFSAEWRIHSSDYEDDVPEGSYDVAVNCWKDNSFIDRHTDDLDFETIFRVVDDDDDNDMMTMTFVDFIIIIDSEDFFRRGQSANLFVEVENRRGETTDCYFGLSIRDPTGKFSIYDSQIILNSIFSTLGPDEKASLSAEWLIPGDAPEGMYDVAVNCWRDGSFADRYTDNLIWQPLFRIGEANNS